MSVPELVTWIGIVISVLGFLGGIGSLLIMIGVYKSQFAQQAATIARIEAAQNNDVKEIKLTLKEQDKVMSTIAQETALVKQELDLRHKNLYSLLSKLVDGINGLARDGGHKVHNLLEDQHGTGR